MAGTALAYAVCDPFDEFVANAHQVLQQWLENLRPSFACERRPTLQALSKLLTQTRGELLGGCLQAAIEQLYRPQLEETTICCKLCGKQLKRKRLDPKLCSTLHGELELHRPYFYCAECCWASHPVDLALGLSRRRHQYDIQEEMVLCSDNDRITHLVSWHRNGDKKRFAADLARITPQLPDTDIPFIVVADGAPWIWKLVSKHFPKARQVLDYYHCAEHIHAVANEQQEDGAAALEWSEATLARLGLGRVTSVIAGLRRTTPRNRAAGEAIRKLIGYLAANRGRVAYGSYREQGIPRGSGGIESANKFIHHCRLKRSGAWWLKPNANRMLAIRCAVRNGTFHRVFVRHVAFQTTLMDI